MIKRTKLFIAVVIFTVITSTFFVSDASAYNYWTNKAKFSSGSVYGKQYYVYKDSFTYNGKTRNYGNVIDQAVSNWNNYVNSGNTKDDVYFYQTTNVKDAEAEFYVNNYGDTGWNGVAEFFNSNGQMSKTGVGPSSNYTYGRAKLNAYYLHNDIDNDIRATAAHEFGHILGLAHSGSLNALMYKNRDRTVYSPATDDRSGILNLY